MCESQTKTTNGTLSQSTRVNFFFEITRDTSQMQLFDLLRKSHNENISDTIKLVFQLRDARGGKGERQQFLRCIRWYIRNGFQQQIIDLLKLIPYYGRWKDLLELMDIDEQIDEEICRLFAETLKHDKLNINGKEVVSLCAKWAPSEGCLGHLGSGAT